MTCRGVLPWFFVLVLAASLPLEAATAAKALHRSKRNAAKTHCLARELKQKDCWLKLGKYDLRLLDQTIAWNDGTWHTVDPMPFSGDGVAWEKISFARLGRHPVLQLYLWDKGVGEERVQSLHWIVAETENRQMKVLAEGIVRKRHQEAVPPAEDGKPPPKPGRILYDPWVPHSLRAVRAGELEWRVGAKKKILLETSGESK
jgi:hypothetical protein